MPMIRYARAAVQPTRLYEGGWDRVRVAARQNRSDRSLVESASKILKRDFDPKEYLLTHCTLVASVDTYAPAGAKAGETEFEGKKVVRKTARFRIKPECDEFINNNLDSWARPVLLKSYKTLVGAHNFLEHVQLEELSKGRILDAVARDIGPSVYVDILVATERKHVELVRDIESGRLNTLSMGCSISGSTCTQCGHWAADDTEMCPHVRFLKGNVFYDEQGQKHRVAELCGDESIEPTGGVEFIEGSWVEVPAFGGARLRNIIEVSSGTPSVRRKVKRQLEAAHADRVPVLGAQAPRKAASARTAEEDPFGEEPAAEEEPMAPEPEKDPLQSLEDEISTAVLDRVKSRLKKNLEKDKLETGLLPSDAPNDTMVKQAARVYRAALADLVYTSTSPRTFLGRLARLNHRSGVFVPGTLYRVALQVGPKSLHPSLEGFLAACRVALKRPPTPAEAKTLIRLAALLGTRFPDLKKIPPRRS